MIAGIGLRGSATVDDLHELLALAPARPQALATLSDKAAHPALLALCAATGLILHPIPRAALAGIPTLTQSLAQIARFGTGSLAEACALHAAGPGAALCGARQIARSARATMAFAERNPA